MDWVPDVEVIQEMRINTGETVFDLSQSHPVMVVFLRHFGCTFCREALADIAKRRSEIEALGTEVVFVHMSDDTTAERYFERYKLLPTRHVSDPECRYYAAFGLTKGNFNQLFGLKSWIRGFDSTVLQLNGVGVRQIGDGFQMPGVFVLREGQVEDAYIHKVASDRPNYVNLAKRCCETS